jgi:hypothetical protein
MGEALNGLQVAGEFRTWRSIDEFIAGLGRHAWSVSAEDYDPILRARRAAERSQRRVDDGVEAILDWIEDRVEKGAEKDAARHAPATKARTASRDLEPEPLWTRDAAAAMRQRRRWLMQQPGALQRMILYLGEER